MRNFQTDPEWEARGEGRVAAVFSNKIDLFDGRNPHDDSSSPNKLQLSHLFSSPYGGATRILLANYIVDMEFVIDECPVVAACEDLTILHGLSGECVVADR
eukprot:GHVU01053373.1.p1 GENE.GHVU01053373.1~~GHVU01053373.1.p1  ORF type:complete len:101 (-),score=13.82 GHVU01053373.1:503-805(-)